VRRVAIFCAGLVKRHRLRRLLLHRPCGNIDRTIADDILIVARLIATRHEYPTAYGYGSQFERLIEGGGRKPDELGLREIPEPTRWSRPSGRCWTDRWRPSARPPRHGQGREHQTGISRRGAGLVRLVLETRSPSLPGAGAAAFLAAERGRGLTSETLKLRRDPLSAPRRRLPGTHRRCRRVRDAGRHPPPCSAGPDSAQEDCGDRRHPAADP
jgi:hypothetical protein